MALLVAVVVKLAETLVKFAVEVGTGSKMAGELSAGATSVLGGRATGSVDRRRAERMTDQLAERLVAQVIDRYRFEYRALSDDDRAAVVQAVVDTFDVVAVGPELVASTDLDSRRLVVALRQQSGDLLRQAGLGRDGELLYDQLLRDACVHVVAVVGGLAGFLPAAQAETLGRLTALRGDVATGFAKVNARLDPLVSGQTVGSAGPAVHEVDDRLARLPPAHRGRLRQWLKDSPESWRVLTALTSVEEDPLAVVRSWDHDPPAWLFSAPVACRLTAAALAAAYDGADLAATLFLSAAQDGAPRREFWTARAALIHLDQDRGDQGRQLVGDLVEKAPLTEPFARAMAAFLIEDWSGLGEELAEWVPVDELDIALHYSLSAREIAYGRGRDNVTREVLDELIAVSRRILERTWIGTVALAHAHHLIMRVERAEADYRHADLSEARAMAVRARDERRAWHGNSVDAAALACQAAEAAGDYQSVLTLGVAGPHGATPGEASSPQVRKFVLLARTWLGDPPDQVTVDDVGDPHLVSAMNAVIAIRRGDDPAVYWRQAVGTASDDAQLARALLGLARCGRRDLPRLEELATRVPALAREIEAAADLATGSTARGIATLRTLARTSLSAASILAGAYSQTGDVDALVRVLRQASDDFADPQLRLEAAYELRRAGRTEEADQEVSTLLAAAPAGWPGVREARQLAAQIAVDNGRLDQGIALLRAVLSTDPDDTRTRWALIDLLFRRADTAAAWRVYRERRGDLEPTGPREAHCWIGLHRQFGDSLDTLRGCLRLVRQFPDSEEVVGHALTALITLQRLDVPVPQEVADSWHNAMEGFFQRWPESSWLRRIDGRDVERAVAELNASARVTPQLHRLRRELFAKAVLGAVPIGVWAEAVSGTYTELVLRRATGIIPAAHLDRGEQRLCETTAMSAAGGTVVIDTTAIVVMNTLPDEVRDHAMGLFGCVMTTDLVLHDARVANELLSRRSNIRWQWDEEAQAGGPVETAQAEADLVAEESRHLVESIERLVRRPRPSTRVAGDRDDHRYSPWMPVLDLAAAEQQPVWVDDVGLRNVARGLGLRVISTPAVIDVLVERGHLTAGGRSHAVNAMFRAGVGDFAVSDQQFLDAARAGDWEPGCAASVALGRPAAWQDPAISLRRMRLLLGAVRRHHPERLPGWLYWCVRGAAFAQFPDPPRACGIAAGLLAITLYEMSANGTAARRCVEACRRALADVYIDYDANLDPLPTAAGLVFRTYAEQVPAELAAQHLVAAMAELDDDDRRAVLLAILEWQE